MFKACLEGRIVLNINPWRIDKMRKAFITTLLVICSIYSWAEKIGTLGEVDNPGRIEVDKKQIYVTQGAAIAIFSLKDFKLVRKIGEKDSGPLEFTPPVTLHVLPDYLFVNSRDKIYWLEKNGEFKKELMAPPGSGFFQPLLDKFVGRKSESKKDSDQVTYIFTYNLFDGHLNEIKELQRVEIPRQPQKFDAYPVTLMFLVDDNKTFISGKPEFVINVFDQKGEPLFTIQRDYERKKLTEADKRKYFEILKLRGVKENMYDFAKKNALFPEYFPAIYSFSIADGKIYIRTYEEKEGKSEFFIYDTDGKFIKKQFIHLARRNPVEPFPYTFRDNKVYQLIESLHGEGWELHATPTE